MGHLASGVLLGGFLVAYGAFVVWTIRRLLSPTAAAQRPSVHRRGIMGFGVLFWVGMTVSRAVGSAKVGTALWKDILMYAYVLLPLALWAGVVWGTFMRSFLGWLSGRDPE